MSPRCRCLLLSCPALLLATLTCAQEAAVSITTTPVSPVAAAESSEVIQPLASPIATPARQPELATADSSSALAAAVAGTCTVIDAMMMEICAQSPNDDYCRQ